MRLCVICVGLCVTVLAGTTRSPVQIQFTASLVGLVAIRAFGAVDDTQATFVRLLEQNAKAWYWWLIGNRWIGFRLDIMCTYSNTATIACCEVALCRVPCATGVTVELFYVKGFEVHNRLSHPCAFAMGQFYVKWNYPWYPCVCISRVDVDGTRRTVHFDDNLC